MWHQLLSRSLDRCLTAELRRWLKTTEKPDRSEKWSALQKSVCASTGRLSRSFNLNMTSSHITYRSFVLLEIVWSCCGWVAQVTQPSPPWLDDVVYFQYNWNFRCGISCYLARWIGVSLQSYDAGWRQLRNQTAQKSEVHCRNQIIEIFFQMVDLYRLVKSPASIRAWFMMGWSSTGNAGKHAGHANFLSRVPMKADHSPHTSI